MNYFSTRDKSLKFSFKDIFLRGLAPDGGLFLPSEIKKYSQNEIKDLQQEISIMKEELCTMSTELQDIMLQSFSLPGENIGFTREVFQLQQDYLKA